MKLKHSVRLIGLKPELLLALMIADQIYAQAGEELVVTSIVDSKHGRGSLHYKGYAFDGRVRRGRVQYSDEIKGQIFKGLREALTAEFDIVLERDHFHIEWDPK